MCRPICHVNIHTKNELQYLFPGWYTSCAWTRCTHNYWQWILYVRHPASQGVGRGLVSVHRSKRCRFHCHKGATLCWDTQRVSPWTTAPQPSKTYKGHRTRVSLLCKNTYMLVEYYVMNIVCFSWISFTFHLTEFVKIYFRGHLKAFTFVALNSKEKSFMLFDIKTTKTFIWIANDA